ncbi:hypothetical protein PSACC_03502 [Paramicrosporidium saccamoebae]|uniref:SDE2-like domain-containing protein n=1 Tax=Paramicrosporidium saccamoebae TaxID=1246581 RepID=A0A2H9TGB4_9FUNG|nr:hypothetical protein PSACC_03502 [Paramicrosporidium saccamoebae]
MNSMILTIPGCGRRVYNSDIRDLPDYLYREYGLQKAYYWLDRRPDSPYIRIRLRLPGGKGGFGSNLRAQGNKMSARKRSGGNDACRDLSGRRLRTVNETRLIEEYLRREPEMERRREAEKKEKMMKDLEGTDKRTVFEDVTYIRTMQETVDSVESAVYAALASSSAESDSEGDLQDGKRSVLATNDEHCK